MNRFLKRVFLVLILMIISFPIYILGIGKLDYFIYGHPYKVKSTKGQYGHLWTRLREADTTRNVDVLILGSSLAYRGIDTRSFDSLGIRAFNLGSSSQTPMQTGFLLDRYLDQLNPKLILWEVSPFTFQNNGEESLIDVSSNYGFHHELLKQSYEIGSQESLKTLTFSLMDQMLFDFYDFNQPVDWKDDKYIKGGFVEKSVENYIRNMPLKKREVELRETQINAFEDQLAFLKNRKLILFQSPINKTDYQAISNREEINDYFNSVVLRYDLQGFYNFNEIEISDLQTKDHFYNQFHLNQRGVEIFNRKLIGLCSIFLFHNN